MSTEEIIQTPLQNLFYYIRDLYNISEECYNFEKEKNNHKSEGVHYWTLNHLIELAYQCLKNERPEFQVGASSPLDISSTILEVRRVPIPAEPSPPPELEDWVLIDRTTPIPTFSFLDELPRMEGFEQSGERVKAFQALERQPEALFPEEVLPSVLKGWVGIREGKLQKVKGKKVVLKFDDDPERVSKGKAYREQFWSYHNDYALPLQINMVFDALHTLYYELKAKDNKRLYLSFGLVQGIIGEVHYRNFLFHVPLKLSLKKQTLKLELDTFASKIFAEQFFASLLDVHFKKEGTHIIEQRKEAVLRAVDRFNATPHEFVLDYEYLRGEYYDKAQDILAPLPDKEIAFFNGENLNYGFLDECPERGVAFSFSPIIQSKLVESQIAVSKDAHNIVNKINELQAQGFLHLIPDFFKKLFLLKGTEVPNSGQHQSESNPISGNGEPAHAAETNRRYLFPLPYNEEQLEIAKRLHEQDAVTVKGPPGTGKSHTIANLISHFVAQGKSILVVSHNAKALSVIKGKLPKAIQDLAVSLVNEGKGNETLKASVNGIIRHLARRYEEGTIKALENELRMLEMEYADTLSDIYKVVQANTKTYKAYHPEQQLLQEKTAAGWAEFLFEGETYSPHFIRDDISFAAETSGWVDKILQLIDTGNQLTPVEFGLVTFTFLPDKDLLDTQELRRIKSELDSLTTKITSEDYKHLPATVLDGDLTRQLADFQKAFTQLDAYPIARQLLQHPSFKLAQLINILQQNSPLKTQVQSIDEELLAFDVDLNPLESTDPDILHRQINQLLVKFGTANTLGWFKRKTLEKTLEPFFACKINYIPCSDAEQFKVLEKEINRRRYLKQLSITLGNYLKSQGISVSIQVSDLLKELDFAVIFSELLAEFNNTLKEKSLPQISMGDADTAGKLQFLNHLKYYAELQCLLNYLNGITQRFRESENAHPLLWQMAEAIDALERERYEHLLTEYKKCRELQPTALAFAKLYRDFHELLPLTARYIKEERLEGRPVEVQRILLEKDMFYLKLHSFLADVTKETEGANGLLLRLKDLKRGIEYKTSNLIAQKTWFHKAQKVSDTQKAALNAWLNDLINIGKGYGKNTARNTVSAIKNMQVAKGAVPIWIMPQETAVTFFPDASPAQFDLLIIDEASQCDISSLNLVFRCKKCLIVGDENQTSVVPNRELFSIGRTNELLDKYLISHRFKTQFDVNNKNNSIYSIASVIYPNIVTLTEHFRCLPEIIGFSNEHVYNGDIIPLKTATEKLYGAPIEVLYVEDNYLDEQKSQIVQRLIEHIESFILQFQANQLRRLPTIGILTLDASNTSHQRLLIRMVQQSELIRQFEDRLELLIGTSREFQGDERDIMYLTVTTCHSINERTSDIRPPRAVTSEEHMRIFNVAASRAKEKSVVLHSIHPDALPLINPDCYRKKLLDYYSNYQNRTNGPAVVKNLQSLLNQVDVSSGEFEKGVCKLLYNNGFGDFLFPQFEVGKYHIDFGLIKNNRKLAIECDGMAYHSGIVKVQEDINRQLILERAGWRFFRIQSTDWFYRNAAVCDRLLAWINDSTTG